MDDRIVFAGQRLIAIVNAARVIQIRDAEIRTTCGGEHDLTLQGETWLPSDNDGDPSESNYWIGLAGRVPGDLEPLISRHSTSVPGVIRVAGQELSTVIDDLQSRVI